MNCSICLGTLGEKDSARQAHRHCLRTFFGTSAVRPVLTFKRADLKGDMLVKHTQRMSISGVQQKLSMKLENGKLALTETGGRYILKPSPQEYPYAAENEHVSMLLGKMFGSEIAQCALVQFSDGERTYITKRYDRDQHGERIHQEDMAQAFGRNRDETGEYKYNASYEQVGKAIREATGGKLSAVLDFFRRLVARFVISDGDFHLKNISLWKPAPSGVYSGLAPNYDMVNTRLYLPEEPVFALDFLAADEFTSTYEKLGYYTWTDFAELAQRIGLTSKAGERVRNQIIRRGADAEALITSSFLPDEMKSDYIAGLRERLRCLRE